MATREPVAVFWDYENCRLSSTSSAYEVVKRICDIAHEYGDVTCLRAYADLKGAMSDQHRTELHCAGASLTDCPHNGFKDVVDNTLIADMLAYAIDHPAPATIILISGDRDFVYALSVLRLRRYRIVLMAPQFVHTSLVPLASVFADWNVDILGKGPPLLSLTSGKGTANHAVQASASIPVSPPDQSKGKVIIRPATQNVGMQRSSPQHISDVPLKMKGGHSTSFPYSKQVNPDLVSASLKATPVLTGLDPNWVLIPDSIDKRVENSSTEFLDSSPDESNLTIPNPEVAHLSNAPHDEPHVASTAGQQFAGDADEISVHVGKHSGSSADRVDNPELWIHLDGSSDPVADPVEHPSTVPDNSQVEITLLPDGNGQTSDVAVSHRGSLKTHPKSLWDRCRGSLNTLLSPARSRPTPIIATSPVLPPPPTPPADDSECSVVTPCSTVTSPPVDSARSSPVTESGEHGSAVVELRTEASASPAHNAEVAPAPDLAYGQDSLPVPMFETHQPDPVQKPSSGDLVSQNDSPSLPSLTDTVSSRASPPTMVSTTAVDPPSSDRGVKSPQKQMLPMNPVFSSLIKLLRERRRVGEASSRSDKVAIWLLSKDPSVYDRAGLDDTKHHKFRRFCALAVRAGIVTTTMDTIRRDNKVESVKRICLNAKWM